MYIWIGCKLPEDFEKELRAHCLKQNQHLGLDASGFSLPQHISLKISFDAGNRSEEILEYLSCLLSSESPFYVNLMSVEENAPILWIPIKENETLIRLHTLLDRELEGRFNIGQHLFDKAFRFHSTLFSGDDPLKLRKMRDSLNAIPFPTLLKIDTFLLGTSPNGKSGSYRVVREIKV